MVRSRFETGGGSCVSRPDRAASARRGRVLAEEQGLPPVQLFDLEADPAEKTNLQAAHPDIVRRLTTLLESYRKNGRSR